MKEANTKLSCQLKQQVTENAYNDAWVRVSKMGTHFLDLANSTEFTVERRVRMLKLMIAYFEASEQYERCAYLKKLLVAFGINWFNTEIYRKI